MPDNQIGLEAVFENEDFQRGVNGYNSAVSDASQNTESAGSRMSDVWNGLGAVGEAALGIIASALAAAGAALVAVGSIAFTSATQIDEAMDSIIVATGATGDELAALQDDFETVFENVPASADEVADVLGTLNVRLGITGENLSDLSTQMLLLAEVTGGDATKNAELFSRVMGDWSIPVDEASGSLDKFLVANQETGASVDKLMQQVVQFGSPLRLMGFTLDESISLFAKWEKEGVNAELVMGSLRIAAGKFADEGKPLRESLLATFDSIMNNTDATAALAEGMEVFGARAGPDMVAAIREGRFSIDDLAASLQGADGAIASAAESTFDFEQKMEIFKNRVTTHLAPLGDILRDALGKATDALLELFDSPEVQAGLDMLGELFQVVGEHVGAFVETVVREIPNIITAIQGIPDWFQENKPLIVGILAAIGVAIAAFVYTTVIPAAVAMITALAPIIAVMAVIGVAAALLYTAWTENWGGIQEKMGELWTVIQPIFNSLVEWLQVNIPIALAALGEFWSNVLLPAIQAVWNWIVSNLVPLFVSLVEWLQANIPAALSTLSAFWTNTLLPAIQAVWGWIQTNLIPLFNAIAELMNAVLTLAITALAGLWQNVLLPAIQAVGGWISDNLLPIFDSLSSTVNNDVMPVLRPFADFLKNVLAKAFEWITNAIQTLIEWVHTLTEALQNIVLPDALTPGSPTPFELGLKGINEQLSRMAKLTLPAVTQEMNVLSTVRDVPGANGAASTAGMVNSNSSVNNYLFGASFNVSNQNGLLEILNGLR